jgi:hypothetical protein
MYLIKQVGTHACMTQDTSPYIPSDHIPSTQSRTRIICWAGASSCAAATGATVARIGVGARLVSNRANDLSSHQTDEQPTYAYTSEFRSGELLNPECRTSPRAPMQSSHRQIYASPSLSIQASIHPPSSRPQGSSSNPYCNQLNLICNRGAHLQADESS